MSQTTTAFDDAELLAALEENEFDIAGLAEFCAEQKCIDRCLRQLYEIIKRHREPSLRDRKLLAQVLVGMVFVARNDYAAEGHQEYWPFLFARIRDAAFADPERFWSDTPAGQQYQALLGRWFLTALDAFGYSIPDEGQKYVGPIVFHAGMPHASLPRVLSVIAAACDQYGPQAVTLPADIRSGLVANHFLHRNVERLLASNLQGAAQLWGCLARVVLAWKTLGDCSEELQQLPLALDPDEVLAALPTETVSSRVSRLALPQLRYDPETGEIRLVIPNDALTDWKVTSGNSPIALAWSRTHLGRTAEFCSPLPEQISVEPTNSVIGIGRTFYPHPSEWPGYWFHGHNGNIEDGQAIDASGLPSGRWFVVFDGTPTKCSVPFIGQVQLKWSWFKGNRDWTAWEVDVPTRTTERTHLEWYVGDNCFRVPLARRPGPRVEFLAEAAAKAFTPDGNQLDVCNSAPTVILRRDSPISVQILRETSESVAVIERLDLQPERPTCLPISRPGVYQLRESRGVGRTLLRFAIVPGFRVQGPTYDAQNSYVSITFSADADAGQVHCDEDCNVTADGNAWLIQSPTVQPFLKARWCWTAEEVPVLAFRWPVEALRWRVTQTGEEYARWTREPIFISPKAVAQHDSQLEIQLPIGSELTINGEPYAGRLQNGPSGSTIVLSLLSFGDALELFYDGHRYAAVFQSERPLLESLEGVADLDSLIVSWKASVQQAGMVVVAWDPCDVLSSPKIFALTDSELSSGEWERSCAELPGSEWTAISLARSVGGFFQRVLHMAARRSDGMEPVSLLVHRSSGDVTLLATKAAKWVEFLHHVSLARLYRNEVSVDDIDHRLAQLESECGFEVENALALVHGMQRLLNKEAQNDRDHRWADATLRSVIGTLNRRVRDNPSLALSKGKSGPCSLNALLALGIPVGQLYPFRWIAHCESLPDSCDYPFAYIRDLWLLGTGRKYLESQLNAIGASLPDGYDQMQMTAAGNVLRFHEELGMPSLSAFLPLGKRTATVASTDRGHRHGFALPPLPDTFSSAADLCESLGLQDKAIDCQATCEDQFFTEGHRVARSGNGRGGSVAYFPNSKGGYSLYWCSDENRWVIESLNASPPTCCYTHGQPLVVDPVQPDTLASTLLRDVLRQWSTNEHPPNGFETDYSFLEGLRGRLVADKISGPLHAELFKPAESERKELFGSIIEIETRPGLSALAIIAWQLAWIERVTAWEGLGHVYEQTAENPTVQNEFLRGLARAITLWPALMRRCIALAELVYWTLYRGGLGAAVRFRSPHTDTQLAALRDFAPTPQRPSLRPPANTKPTADHVENISGVIVGYNAGVGIVLLHHRSSSSLDVTVRDYVNEGDAERHWFASFRWNALTVEDRNRLQQLFSRRSQSRRQSHPATLADVMCGLRVTCELSKKPRWEAISLNVNFGLGQMNIPKYRRRQPQ